MQWGLVHTSDLLSNLCSPQEPAYLTLVFLNGAGKPMAQRGGSLLPWVDPRTRRPRGVELCRRPRWSLRYCGAVDLMSEHQSGPLRGRPAAAPQPEPSSHGFPWPHPAHVPCVGLAHGCQPKGAAGRQLTGTASFCSGLCAAAARAQGTNQADPALGASGLMGACGSASWDGYPWEGWREMRSSVWDLCPWAPGALLGGGGGVGGGLGDPKRGPG